jgi:SAM-dependent methyltransferase
MDILHKEVVCSLCGGEAYLKEEELPGYKEPEKFSIYECKVCDSSFSMPQISDQKEVYDLIYNNVTRIPNYYRYWQYAESVIGKPNPFDYLSEEEESYWIIKQAFTKKIDVNSDSLILEIGCGLGYLTYSLNESGFKATGIDISEEAIAYAISKYGENFECTDVEEFSLKYPNKFDIIIMTEVLEHVQDVKKFLIDSKKLLKNSGKIILSTPNKSIFKGYSNWLTELPPIHSWWFSETSLIKCSEILGMGIEFLDFREFYRNPQRTRFIDLMNIKTETPTFSKLGDLKLPEAEVKELTNKKKRLKIVKLLFGERLYNILRVLYYSFKGNFLILGKKGYSLGVILYCK